LLSIFSKFSNPLNPRARTARPSPGPLIEILKRGGVIPVTPLEGPGQSRSWPGGFYFCPANALFAGSDSGGEHRAAIASLIETCKLTGVDPHAYLADVVSKIVNGHPNNRIDELLSWAYPAAHPL
jgi:IS66 C-terminal element